MAFKTQARLTPCSPDELRLLTAAGKSLTKVARYLHIAPRTLKARLAADETLSEAYRLGLEDKNKLPAIAPGRRQPDDYAEYGVTPKPLPIDDIILAAIKKGTCDRPAIEKFLTSPTGRRQQILPALERLMSSGKIFESPRVPGRILTTYGATSADENSNRQS